MAYILMNELDFAATQQIFLALHKFLLIIALCWAFIAQSPPPSSFGGIQRSPQEAALFFGCGDLLNCV
jgi:hypothetical protein